MNPELLLYVILFLGALILSFQVVSVRFGLTRVEAKLDRLLERLGVEPHPPLSERVRAFADGGQKIDAIKALREETGMGLAEAKRAVEAYQAAGSD